MPATAASECVDRRRGARRRPVGGQQLEVEGQVQLVGAHVLGEPLVVGHPDLADGHPCRGTRRAPRGSAGARRARRPGRSAGRRGRGRRAARCPRVGTMSGSPSGLAMPCATSMRNPSTPRSSQNRSVSLEVGDDLGVGPSSGRAARGRRGAGTTAPSGTRVHAGPPKTDGQLFGGSLAVGAAPVAEEVPRPLRGARARRPAPPGTTRGRASCGWAPGRWSPGCRARARRRAARRTRRGRRTPARRRGGRPRRSRGRPSARGRTA